MTRRFGSGTPFFDWLILGASLTMVVALVVGG